MSDNTETEAMVDDLFERAFARRELRETRLQALGFESAEAMRRKIAINEAISHLSLADAARALLDAVVWRYDGPDNTASADLRGVSVALLRNLEDALP